MSTAAFLIASVVLGLVASQALADWWRLEGSNQTGVGLALTFLLLIAFITPYRMWKDGQRKIVELEGRLANKMTVSFGPDIPGCVVSTNFTHGIRARFFRLKVENSGGRFLQNCSGQVTRIEKNGAATRYGDSLKLTWAPAEGQNSTFVDLRDQVPEFLDLLAVTEKNVVALATPGFRLPNAILDLLDEPAEYRLRVVISSPNTTSCDVDLVLKWTGNWETVGMEQHNAGS